MRCYAPIARYDKRRPLLVFAFNFYPQRGGIQTYSYELCRHLHKLGYTLVVLARDWPGAAEFDAQVPYKVIRMKGVGVRFLRLLPMMFYFAAAVLRHRIRLVHCINWIPCGAVARLFRHVLFYKYVVTCHGAEITMAARSFFRQRAMVATLRKAAWLIAGNNHVREALNRFPLSRTPVSVIGFGVDEETFRPGLDAEFLRVKYGARRKKVLLTVAELRPRKGVDTVLGALKILGERARDIVYLVVGDGPDRSRLTQMAQDYGLSEQVIFTGFVSDRDLPYHYALSDIYIMPNRGEANGDVEGFGITFIEAQASEKPVIGGKSGGVVDSVADGKTGYLVDPLDEAAVATAILRLLDEPETAQAFAKNGRQRVLSLFSWNMIAGKTEMVYDKIFEPKRRR
ncbi:MAG: glycosyltransferase family 4 protein [Fibrobacterota bacterium]